jgi:cytidine deaminase
MVGHPVSLFLVQQAASVDSKTHFFYILPKKKGSMKINYGSLVRAAISARKKSHAPYSKFRVGAALLAASGKVFTGCNIENSSYSLTMCAERTAIFKAYSEGVRKFKAIAVVSDSGNTIPPCGACRQVLQDLAPGIEVVLADRKGQFVIYSTDELLPHPFTDSFLKG